VLVTTPVDAIQYTWQFTLNRTGTDEDIAEFSIWGTTESGARLTQDEMDLQAQYAADNFGSNVGEGDYCDNVTLASCTTRMFDSVGHTQIESIQPPSHPWQGSAVAPALPWETSLCVSLYTYQPGTFIVNGRRHRGRFYLPPMAAAALDTSNSGYLKNSSVAPMLAGMKVFINAVGLGADDTYIARAGVFSRMDSVVRQATYVVLDAKFDSQRRRQNRETAGRVNLPL